MTQRSQQYGSRTNGNNSIINTTLVCERGEHQLAIIDLACTPVTPCQTYVGYVDDQGAEFCVMGTQQADLGPRDFDSDLDSAILRFFDCSRRFACRSPVTILIPRGCGFVGEWQRLCRGKPSSTTAERSSARARTIVLITTKRTG